ncbi:hypothetical protein ACFLTH_12590 [Bacteroidota bacterium]
MNAKGIAMAWTVILSALAGVIIIFIWLLILQPNIQAFNQANHCESTEGAFCVDKNECMEREGTPLIGKHNTCDLKKNGGDFCCLLGEENEKPVGGDLTYDLSVNEKKVFGDFTVKQGEEVEFSVKAFPDKGTQCVATILYASGKLPDGITKRIIKREYFTCNTYYNFKFSFDDDKYVEKSPIDFDIVAFWGKKDDWQNAQSNKLKVTVEKNE